MLTDLAEKGYCIIENVLNDTEIHHSKESFNEWYNNTPNLKLFHEKIDPHGIFKYHEVGHQYFSWYLRTRPQIIDIFQKIWNTKELVVSFDGCCYISNGLNKKDNIWTHTDQASNNSELTCYQAFVSLTNNEKTTLIVYEGSHLLHKEYFKDKPKSSTNWNLIDQETLEKLKDSKKVLKVKSGSLVIWDSRTFHQNCYGNPSEERLVQYLSYLPKESCKNTKAMQSKRLKYFLERRTTSHWAYPIRVNSLQPQTYGDKTKLIDYSTLKPPYLENLMDSIKKLI